MEQSLLKFLNDNNSIPDTIEYAQKFNHEHNEVVGLIKGLDCDEYVKLAQKEKKVWKLTADGIEYAEKGTPEFRIYTAIPPEGISKEQVIQKPNIGEDGFKFGLQNGMKKKWFTFQNNIVKKNVPDAVDDEAENLKKIKEGQELSKEVIENLKKRKTIELSVTKFYEVVKGPNFALSRKKKATDLTHKMIASGSWETEVFKDFNYNALGKEIENGALHPLMKVREQFRIILLEMGFQEMPTNNYVESSFWNFDSLFQPQQHPARDSHDTFFIADPKYSKFPENDYWKTVKNMHEKGGSESIGWRYNWSEEEAKKNIFRTHTTAVSSRMLYELAQQKEFKPTKWFSIDRVFRNENLDATHLAEFHQIEGVVVDRGIGLGHLKGIIKEFFYKIGIKDLKFKPAYNPYTEPSMEIFAYHPELKRWIEIGNSGVFRPEMLIPMGLPKDVSVVAWGLSLERPTMIQYKVANIRELFGHKVSVKDIKENKMAVFL
jgi:phenylalanyl-tRNA synthetase alpha chain